MYNNTMKIRRNISVNKDLWERALKKAKELDRSLSSLISEYLRKLIKK